MPTLAGEPWQHDARIDPARLHCAHSTALLLELIRNAGMISYCPRPLLLTEPMRGWVHAIALAEQFETSRLGIITRHNAVRNPAAQCFTDCLLQEIRRRARSAAQKDSELFDELEVLF
ncbi:LysR substrate-binding domain-containing protein [Cupriavidus sp. NPDC089707]|uniref:LysR substrate-binding domain-containing protein n=1 Tax=Cupriavidus sp. NPDC089707 TaxID=3363963 RepID=UPI0037F756E1